MQPILEDVEFLEHHGVKGMKWGVTRNISRSERKAGRQELRTTARTARKIIKSATKAQTPQEKQAAIKAYRTQVLEHIKSPAFKKAYQDANTMGKGEMAAQILTSGPLAALTIPAIKKQYAMRQTIGPESEIGAAKAILEQMRNS